MVVSVGVPSFLPSGLLRGYPTLGTRRLLSAILQNPCCLFSVTMTATVPTATGVFLSSYLKETPNVVKYDVAPLRFSGRKLADVLERTRDFLADRLDEMSMTDPYWTDCFNAYSAIPLSSGHVVNMVAVTGGPGCGKTEVIKRICCEVENCTVMVPFKRLQSDYRNGERCFTQNTCVARHMTTDLLLVDEFTGCDIGLVCAAALNQKCSEVILWGDVMQTWLSDSEGVGFRDFKIPCVVKLRSNFRNPPATVALLNAVFSDDMVPMSGSNSHGVIKVKPLYGTDIGDGVSLTGTRLSVDELRDWDIPAVTVRSSQGATYDDVNLLVFQRDLNIFTNSAIVRVALSRHRRNLIVHTVDCPAFEKLVDTGRLVNDHIVGLDLYEVGADSGWLQSWFVWFKCRLLGL